MAKEAIKNLSQRNQGLILYQCALAVVSIFLFFTNLDVYLYLSKIVRLEPLIYIVLVIFASIPLFFFVPIEQRSLPKNLLKWSIAYLFLSVFAFWLYPSLNEPLQALKDRMLSLLFMLVMAVVFSKFYVVQQSARYAVVGANLVSIFNNIYEFMNPGVFAGLNLTGRAAGFYIDSNSSGDGVLLGLILGLGVLPEKFRMLYALLSGIGIFVTFSRGALIGWIIVMIILYITKAIPRKPFLLYIIGIFFVVILINQGGQFLKQIDTSFISKNALSRLEDFGSIASGGGGDVEDDAAAGRKLVAKLGWEKFLENPFVGHGLGASQFFDVGALVSHEISTHNTYLAYMVDHGILGTFVLPMLVLSVTYPARGEGKNVSFAFAIFVILWGLFSHTILIQRLHLLTFSLMAIMNQTDIKADSVNSRGS